MKNRNIFFAQLLDNKPLAVYSGWGPNEERNPGDTICRNAMFDIIHDYIPNYRPIDIRPNRKPADIPWRHNAIVGGGTVFPKVFNNAHASGILAANKIFLLGSGCLSAADYQNQTTLPVASINDANIIPLGLRGPASVRNFKEFYGIDADWVGDLAFYYAQETPRTVAERKKISIYYIEECEDKCRLIGNPAIINKALSEVCQNPDLKNFDITIYHTSNHKSFLNCDNVTHKKLKDEKEFFDSIKNSDFIITERLHPAILGTCYGIPFLYLQTTSKSQDLNEIFEDTLPGKNLHKLFLNMAKQDVDIVDHVKQCLTIPNIEHLLIDVAQQMKKRLCMAAEKLNAFLNAETDINEKKPPFTPAPSYFLS